VRYDTPLPFYLAPDRGAEYCDERVCLFVRLSVRDHILAATRPIFTNFFVRVTYGRGSVLLRRRSDMLCTSGFTDDVIFAHRPRLLDVAFTSVIHLQQAVRCTCAHFLSFVSVDTQPWAWL